MAKQVITLETLKKGVESLGLKIPKNTDEDKLKKLVKETLEGMETTFQCPTCEELIPDVSICPYCGQTFSEEEASEDNKVDETTDDEAADESEKIEEKKPEPKPEPDKKADKKTNEKDDKKEKPKNDKKVEKPAAEKTDKPKKEKAEVVDYTTPAIPRITKAADTAKLFKKDGKTLLSFFKEEALENRIFSVLKTSKNLVVYFIPNNFKTKVDGLTILTDEEAKKQHLGKIRAIYEGTDTAIVEKLIAEITK